MQISVIIPTYNRPRTLLQALRSLQEQTISDFEIVVVDNAANMAINSLVSNFNKTARIAARYISEPRLGVHYARNSAAQKATGDLLLYADDDMSFDPHWVAAFARAFLDKPEMAAAAGPVWPIWEERPPEWLLNYIGDSKVFGILSLMYDSFQLNGEVYFFSCNMAIWKTVLQARDGFHPEATGDAWLGDGETGLNQEMLAKGDLIGYVSDALAYHHIPRSRMTAEYFCRRMANEGACDVYSRFHHAVPHWLRLLKHAAGITIRNSMSWAAACFHAGLTDPRSLRIRLDAARTQSQFKYIIRLMLNKELRHLVVKKNWFNES